MGTSVSWNGSNYTIPAVGDRLWGQSVTNFLISVAQNALSKAGGSFTLTADANFGSNYGLVAKYLKSVSSNISATGVVRFANDEGLGWRNSGNSADKILKVNATDRLTFDGVNVPTISSTDTLTNKTIAAGSNTITGLTKSDVGLGNVDNTSDATKNAATATFTNKIYDGGTASSTSQIKVPKAALSVLTALGRAQSALYYDTDSNKLVLDNGSTLTAVGTGAGTGLVNYVTNADAETDTTGWATYADAAAATPVDGTGGSPNSTFTRNTTTPLRGNADFKWSKGAANRQGEGFSYAFTISTVDKSKKLQISVDLNTNTANYAAGDMVCYVYDVTNATLITPSSTSVPKTTGSFAVTFDSTTSTSYRLIFHTATTNATAYDLYFDNFYVGPGILVQGAAIGAWQSYTPTLTDWGTAINVFAEYRQVGDTIEIRGRFTSGTTTGSSGITLPAGLTAYLPAGGTTRVVGKIWDSVASDYTRVIIATNGSNRLFMTRAYTASDLYTEIGSNNIGASALQIAFEIAVPITSWTSTVNLGAGNREEYAYPTGTVDADSSSTGSATAYGREGATWAAMTDVRNKYILWQYPPQQGDLILIETSQDSGASFSTELTPWNGHATSTSTAGIKFVSTTAGVTRFQVGRYAEITPTAWSSSYRIRFRKVSPTAPSGFGLAGTDGSSGLVAPYSAAGVVASGTYTPTLASVTNVASTVAFQCSYSRVGSQVTVFGYLVLQLYLPIDAQKGSVISLLMEGFPWMDSFLRKETPMISLAMSLFAAMPGLPLMLILRP